jgi:Na+-transporting methylmalonyl-CoA/oxaloacetate decarboxylase gamma subunit
MNIIWRSNLGRLFLGGCGTQIGMAFVLITLGFLVLFGSICALSNVVAIAVTQEITSLSGSATAEEVAAASFEAQAAPIQEVAPVQEAAPAPEAAPDAEVELLRSEIASLVGQVENLQAREASQPAVIVAPPPAPMPFALSHKGRVSLRSGPGPSYTRIGSISLGDRVEILGRNEESSWWLVDAEAGMAWLCADFVVAYDVPDDLPVVTIPALLSYSTTPEAAQAQQPSTAASAPMPEAPAVSAPALPAGTPTPGAAQSRVFVEDTEGHKQLRWQLGMPPTSASFSPQGDQIAITEGTKLYLVTPDAFEGHILMEENGILKPVGGVVWSPDGSYLAVVVQKLNCDICRSVALVRLEDNTIFFLKNPGTLAADAPRWTQDGRLLLNAHPGEPADGTTYIYDLTGRGEVASGTLSLSSSQHGQRWYPWRPGRIWRAGVSERADAYNSD